MRARTLASLLLSLAVVACAPTRDDAPPGELPPPSLFAADGAGGQVGSLWSIDLADGEVTEIGPLPVPLTGLALDSRGDLYGTESSVSGGAQLWSIDRRTADAVAIGILEDSEGGTHNAMPDITFSGDALFGWTERQDGPVRIDPETGAVTPLGGGTSSSGSGLAANREGQVFVAPNGPFGSLFEVDPETGGVTERTRLDGAFGGVVNSMTFVRGTLYAVAGNNGASGDKVVVTIDLETGALTTVGPVPSAVDSLAGFPP